MRAVLDVVAAEHPTVSKVWVDDGYQTVVWRQGAQHGIDVEVVTRGPSEKGFRVLPRRWVVERTFGWLMQHRRLARDYEALPQRSRAMVLWAHRRRADGAIRDHLVIDLAELTFLDSSGIIALHTGYKIAAEQGATFRVDNPRGIIRRTLIVTGLLDILSAPPSVFDDVTSAEAL